MEYAASIRIIPENCRGCRRCQVVCSSFDPGPLNPRLAGIQILPLENDGGHYPVINMECQERFCGKTHTRGPELKPACVSACLFGALEMSARRDGNEQE